MCIRDSYEAATEPLVDPLCTSGDIQVGFFNQSKNMNRQVPLFELAEESKPMLEMASGEAATLKVRINDLSSHHQNQRFILVAGPADRSRNELYLGLVASMAWGRCYVGESRGSFATASVDAGRAGDRALRHLRGGPACAWGLGIAACKNREA